MLQDSSGTMWVGTDAGLDRFSQPVFLPFTDRKLADDSVMTSCPDGDVWLGDTLSPLSSRFTQVFPRCMGKSDTYSTCIATGKMWCGSTITPDYGSTGMAHCSPDTHVPTGFGKGDIRQLTGRNEHRIFMAVRRSGVWLFEDGNWSRILDETPGRILEDSKGNLWRDGGKGRIAIWDGTRSEFVDFEPNSPGTRNDPGFLREPERHGGGRHPGHRFAARGGRFHQLFALHESALVGISGILESKNGDLWLNGSRGVVQGSFERDRSGTRFKKLSNVHRAIRRRLRYRWTCIPDSRVADGRCRFHGALLVCQRLNDLLYRP